MSDSNELAPMTGAMPDAPALVGATPEDLFLLGYDDTDDDEDSEDEDE